MASKQCDSSPLGSLSRWVLTRFLSAKSYKRRLKAWGLTKYIKLGAGQDELALQETFPDSTQALATRQRHGYVRLANGRLVDADTVAMHLRRKARSKYSQRNPKFQACPPTVVRAPERFRVLEGVYANVRAYMLGRFDETITVSQDVDTLRAWDPYSGRWLRFSAAVQAACRDNKMNDAYVQSNVQGPFPMREVWGISLRGRI